MHAQVDAIVDALRALDFAPNALPASTRKGGAKAATWKRLQSMKDLFGSRSVFDSAWERARKQLRIADAVPSRR
jgi:hypothetical protein